MSEQLSLQVPREHELAARGGGESLAEPRLVDLLEEVPGGACGEGGRHAGDVRVGGEDDHPGRVRLATQLPKHREPVAPRQVEVEEDQVWPLLANQLEPFLSVPGD